MKSTMIGGCFHTLTSLPCSLPFLWFFLRPPTAITSRSENSREPFTTDSKRSAHSRQTKAATVALMQALPPIRMRDTSRSITIRQPTTLHRPVRPQTCSISSDRLQAAMGKELANHEMNLEVTPEGFVISLRELGFFNSGQAELLPGAGARFSALQRSCRDPVWRSASPGIPITSQFIPHSSHQTGSFQPREP